MALSNIVREPRRELVEQAFGLVAVIGLLVGDLIVALGLCLLFDGTIYAPWQDIVLSMVFAVPIIAAGVFLVGLMHRLGEEVCDFLADRGFDPRPTQRWR